MIAFALKIAQFFLQRPFLRRQRVLALQILAQFQRFGKICVCQPFKAQFDAGNFVAQILSEKAGRLKGPYALVVDGVYFTFDRREWVLYLMAVKPLTSHRMYFLDPVLVKGRERLEVWQGAIGALSNRVQNKIRALVSDGLPGFSEFSTRRGWVYQRCHFHLLASLVRGKGMRRYRTRGSQVRERVLKAVRVLLGDASTRQRSYARTRLLRFRDDPLCPAYVRKHIKELLWSEEDFRAYLMHPKLHLPTTTNAMESTGRLVRKATRTARTPPSLLLRATAFLRLKRSVVCNGHCDTQN